MFSRVRVKDAGSSLLIPGEVLERAKFLEINSALKKEGKNPAKGVPVLLGISRVALTTNSFLSAASLSDAAILAFVSVFKSSLSFLYFLSKAAKISALSLYKSVSAKYCSSSFCSFNWFSVKVIEFKNDFSFSNRSLSLIAFSFLATSSKSSNFLFISCNCVL
jgi:hypothetical protein